MTILPIDISGITREELDQIFDILDVIDARNELLESAADDKAIEPCTSKNTPEGI